MSLIKKAQLLILLIITLTLIVGVIVIKQLIISQFERIEASLVNKNTQRVIEAINEKVDNLELFNKDWAWWDDAYNYVTEKDEDFEKSNLVLETFTNRDLDVLIITDNDSKLVWGRQYDPQSNQLISLDQSIFDNLDNLANPPETGVSGILGIRGRPLIVSSLPILKSNKEGPQNGALIMGYFLDEEVIGAIKHKTKLDFLIGNSASFDPSLNPGAIGILPPSGDSISGVASIKDIYDKEISQLKIDNKRDIYNQGLDSAKYFFLNLLVMWLFASIAGFLFFKFMIARRLAGLGKDLDQIGKERDFSRRVSELGNDEIGRLSKEINKTLESLEKYKKDAESKTEAISAKITEIETQKTSLEDTKTAIINILEDQKEVEEELRIEKQNEEKKVLDRTAQLNEEKLKLASSIESLGVGFVMTDTTGEIVLLNGLGKRILCSTAYEIGALGVITPEDIKDIKCDINFVSEKLKGVVDIKAKISKCLSEAKPFDLKDIEFAGRFYHIFFNPIVKGKDDIKVIGCVLILEDETDEKLLQRSRDEFFSIASHELRTPLTSIRGNTSMVLDYFKDALKDPQMKEMIEDVHTSSVRLIEIVNDFLDTSRLEMGRMKFVIENLEINGLIDEVVKEYTPILSQKGLGLKFESTEKISAAFDKDRFKQVLINLIGNANKFTEKGGITISLKKEGEFAKVLVTDTGRGITPEGQQLLFKKFQQTENNIKTRDATQGTGLGLYISKLLVEGMKGQLSLESSEIGKGTTFAFTLPIAQTATTAKPIEPKQTPE